MHKEDIQKGKLNRKKRTNTSWLEKEIKYILKTPIQKLDKPTFFFNITNEATASNSNIILVLNGDLGAEIAAQKFSPLNYGSEFRNTADLIKLFYYNKDKINTINIIHQG